MKKSIAITRQLHQRQFLAEALKMLVVILAVETYVAPRGIVYDYFGTGKSDIR